MIHQREKMSNNAYLAPTSAKRLAQSVLGDAMVGMADIAAHEGVTYRTVQAWRRAGILPPPDFAVGKVVRWRHSTIQSWAKSRSAAGVGE